MGQILILAGGSVERRSHLAARGLELFRTLAGIEPIERLESLSLSVYKFPKLAKPSMGIALETDRSSWATGAGAWIDKDGSPALSLHRLLTGVARGAPGLAETMSKVEGSFVLAAGDGGSRGSCYVITDRVGTLHAYHTTIDSVALICTSSLVLAALSTPSWDPMGTVEFLSTGTIFEDRTLFQGITKLQPARIYSCSPDGVREAVRYWRFEEIRYQKAGTAESVRLLATALQTALERVAQSYERPLLDLTGGYDSRAVVTAMAATGAKFETVVNGPRGNLDVEVASRVAQAGGYTHHHQAPAEDNPIDWWSNAKESLALCDGEYDLLEYARILDNHRCVFDKYDVSVNGSGGEFCKGYWWELLFPMIGSSRYFDPRRIALGRFATDSWGPTLAATASTGRIADHFAGVVERAADSVAGHPNTAKLDKVYLELRMQRWQGRIASATNRLWPCISPFMFAQVMECAFSTPPRIRFGNQMSARLLESLDPDVAAVPLTMGYPALPVRWSNLHRFTPLVTDFARAVARNLRRRVHVKRTAVEPTDPGARLRGLLAISEVRELLEPSSMRTRELYDTQGLELFVAAARSGGIVLPYRLGRVLTLEYSARWLQDVR